MTQPSRKEIETALAAWRKEWLEGPPEQDDESAMRAALIAAVQFRPVISQDALNAQSILELTSDGSGTELTKLQELSLLRRWYEGTKIVPRPAPADRAAIFEACAQVADNAASRCRAYATMSSAELRGERVGKEIAAAIRSLAGETPGPSTLAATDDVPPSGALTSSARTSVSESRRGEPAPASAEGWGLITMGDIRLVCGEGRLSAHDVLRGANVIMERQRAAAPAAPSEPKTMTEDQIKHMVNRFLSWRLPENFNPDAGISFKATFNEHTSHPMRHEPTGTNLFDFTQATAMVRHMIEGISSPDIDALARVREALETIAIRCEEDDPSFNWRPTLASIARRALSPGA